jgi:WD40 repeat protein/serine/threonine protein kinase
MPVDDRVVELLMLAEELREQGKPVVPSELCRACPELLPELLKLMRGTDAVEQMLNVSSATQADSGGGPSIPIGALPSVRGYEIHRELGRGGMGVVYEADQQALGRRVALKVLPTMPGQDPKRVSRFKREVRAAARLHHTNIVPVFEVGEDAGVWFYAMQYIPGRPISDVLSAIRRRRDGRPSALTQASESPPTQDTTGTGPEPAAAQATAAPIVCDGLAASSPDVDPARYFRDVATAGLQVAEALACAHSHGVLHRDIKPANLIADDSGRVWVTDFGLAKIENENLTQSGTVLGTLRYSAPEQVRGAPDVRSDVYSLGLTLYELLTLQPAFEADTPLRLLDQVAHTEPPRPRSVDRRIPRDLETIVLKAIDKDPARRYQTAAEMAGDLQRFLADEPIRARPISVSERLVRWARRRPALASLSGGLLVVTALGFAGILWQWSLAVSARGFAEREKVHAEQLFTELRAKHETILRQMYRANIVAATDALQLTNTSAVRKALAATPESQRGWEWHHLFNQLDISRAVLRAHDEPVLAVGIRPDRRRIVSLAADGELRVWDAASRETIHCIATAGHIGVRPITLGRLQLTPDGRWAVARAGDGAVHVVDTETGREHRVIRAPRGTIESFTLSPDGRQVATVVAKQTLSVWDLASGTLVSSMPCSATGGATWSPDRKHVAYIDNNAHGIRIVDLATRSESAIALDQLTTIDALHYSPDGSRLATGSGYPDNGVRLWDAASRQLVAEFRDHKNRVEALAFSPDGRRLASASTDHTVWLWDTDKRKAIATLRGHTEAPWQLAFNHTGTRLATASGDQTVRLWNGESGASIAVLRGHVDEVSDVTFSGDGTLLASSSIDGTVRLWDLELAERSGVLRGHGSFVYDVAFSPDGQRVASAAWDGTVRTWDATTGRPLATLDQASELLLSVAYTPDGRQLAVFDRNHSRITLWDLAKAQPILNRPIPEVGLGNGRLAISPAGNLLAATGSDGTVHLWNLPLVSQAGILHGHTGRVECVAIRQDGMQVASGGQDKTICLWDARKLTRSATLRGPAAPIYHVAYSADGRMLAAASAKDVYIWNLERQEEPTVLHHGVGAYSIAFRPETDRMPSRLAVGCSDNTIRLWDLRTANEVAELRGHEAYVHAVAFSPDGTRLVSGSGDGTVRVWDSLSVQERAAREASRPRERAP